MKKNRFFAGVISATMVLGSLTLSETINIYGFGAISAQAAEVVDSGTCGDNLTWVLDDEGVLTISGTGEMDDYNGFYPYTAPWYSSRTSIVSIVIEDGVTGIGNYAFAIDYSNLVSVDLPDTLTSIGDYAFFWCNSLTDIDISDNITDIGAYAFSYCDGLADENGFVIVKNQLFSYCGDDLEIVIPSDAITIGSESFIESDITSVVISEGVEEIGDSAFKYDANLENVEIGNTVTTIGALAFYGCQNLKSVTIPDSVTSIGGSAFGYYLGENGGDKVEGFTIYGYIGSAAETYAEENRFTFVALQFEINSLSEVPDSLSDKYDSVDALIEAMTALVTTDDSYTEDNTAVYDVVLMISTDGGTTWQEATEDDFSENGITVTIPYPDGTDSSYDFVVAHMFTETSESLGTVAGEVEYPTVTKTDDGIQVTLKGLSPVAISWSLNSSADNASTSTSGVSDNNATNTGNNAGTSAWWMLICLFASGLVVMAYIQKRRTTVS